MLKHATAAVGLAMVCAAPAWAQLTKSNAPIDLTADQLEVMNNDCAAIWSGSAEALQGDARLRADVLKIYNEKQAPKAGSNSPACGNVDRIEATGSVYYVTPDRRVRGDAAVYQSSTTTITFTGDVVAVQGKNVLRGQKLIVNTDTNQAQMLTNSKGRNAPNRVRGVFYPKDSNTNATNNNGGQAGK